MVEKNSTKRREGLGREIGGLLFMAGAIFLLASLVSFDPNDPALKGFHISGSNNWMGPVGANLAQFLLDIWGYGAWLWVPAAAAGGLYLFRPFFKDDVTPGLFIYGWVGGVLAVSGLLSLFTPSWGGIAGKVLTGFLKQWIGVGGAGLLLVVILCSCILAATPLTLTGCANWLLSLATGGKEGDGEQARPKAKALALEQDQSSPPLEPEARPRIAHRAVKEEPSKDPFPDELEIEPVSGEFVLPSPALLAEPPERQEVMDQEAFLANASILEQKLKDFGVSGKVVEICPGPVVTMYEFAPAPGVKINKVASLADDLALALKTTSIRIVAPIPGKGVIGIELANPQRQTVYLREIIVSKEFQESRHQLALALGQDIVGTPVVADLARMPHLLIAGATGTGKSVGLNSMICSLLYRHTPETLRLLMVDPKRIELSLYDGIPHLLHPVVSDPSEATRALRWAVTEMERRYQLLEEARARNLQGYNRTADEPLPYLVVIVDELADLMMVSSKEVEAAIARLAQMARAAGIHLIIATQRPSVDVLTGLIKANFPARISFKVSSRVDSRTILDTMGAERLLGMGDMLFLEPGGAYPARIHGAYVSEPEIERIVEFLKEQGEPQYDMTVAEPVVGEESPAGGEDDGEFSDPKYDEAVEIVTQGQYASVSMLQRKMRIGYNRAARMVEQMEREGVVSPPDHKGRRKVLVRGYDDRP